jgi:hypothetical protein
MADSERSSSFRQPFLALMASLAAFMALFGVTLPNPGSKPDNKPVSEAKEESATKGKPHAEPTVVDSREWEDPFAELELLFKKSDDRINPGEGRLFDVQRGKNPNAIKAILREKLSVDPNSRLLVVLQIVSGPSNSNAKESRTLWGHAFRMALSENRMNRVAEQQVASLECKVDTEFGGVENLQRTVVLPMKLYEGEFLIDKKAETKRKHYLLNFWVMDDYLGDQPWKCLGSIYRAIHDDLKLAEKDTDTAKTQAPIAERTALAIVGPGGSGILESMNPSKDTTGFLVNPTSPPEPSQQKKRIFGDFPIYWINAHCTVPIKTLWNLPGDAPLPPDLKSENQPIDFVASIPDDGQLIGKLAIELRTRLDSIVPGNGNASNRLLVFYEDDSTFGRNLFVSLKSNLDKLGDLGEYGYECVPFPYLRGIGSSSSANAAGASIASSPEVADYFRRTMDAFHGDTGQVKSTGNQPVAIGILGGEVQDKIALLREVRIRYPQAIVFTNDLNVQYLNKDAILFTRNLLVAAHAGLTPTLQQKRKDSSGIVFRDESQTTLWNGYQSLFRRFFGDYEVRQEKSKEGVPSNESDTTDLSKPTVSLFEVGNSAFLEIEKNFPGVDGNIQKSSTVNETSLRGMWSWVVSTFKVILGVQCVVMLFTFPLLHAYWAEHIRISRRCIAWIEHRILLPIASFFFRKWAVPFDFTSWINREVSNLAKNSAVIITCLVVFVLCLTPVSLSECDWYDASPSIWGNLRSQFLNHLTTWFTGVSVIPSILLLTVCLPLTFWPSIKKDIERAFELDTPMSNSNNPLPSQQSLDERIRNISHAMGKIKDSRDESGEDASESRPADNATSSLLVLSDSIRDRIPLSLSYLVVGCAIALWQSFDDPWMLQITALAAISCLLSSCPTVRWSIFYSFLIGVFITIAAWVFNDVSYVPARDALVRIVGSCVFAVAYWWLLIGLLKLFIHQRRLRVLLRDGSRKVDRICEDQIGFENLDNLEEIEEAEQRLILADQAMTETQSVSRIISRDLSQLAFVGLIVCFARMPWFDAWGMSVATWLMIVLPMAAPFISSIFLRRKGFEFRDACLRYQTDLSFAVATYRGADSATEPTKVQGASVTDKKQLEELGKRLTGWQSRFKGYDRGVFSPLDRDPLVSTGLSLALAFSSGPQGDLVKRLFPLLLM